MLTFITHSRQMHVGRPSSSRIWIEKRSSRGYRTRGKRLSGSVGGKQTSTPQHSCSFSDSPDGFSGSSQFLRKMHWLLWSTVRQTRQRLVSEFARVNIPLSICMGIDVRGRAFSLVSVSFKGKTRTRRTFVDVFTNSAFLDASSSGTPNSKTLARP